MSRRLFFNSNSASRAVGESLAGAASACGRVRLNEASCQSDLSHRFHGATTTIPARHSQLCTREGGEEEREGGSEGGVLFTPAASALPTSDKEFREKRKNLRDLSALSPSHTAGVHFHQRFEGWRRVWGCSSALTNTVGAVTALCAGPGFASRDAGFPKQPEG